MLPALSDKYSARESAISLPREPGGLIKQMRSTKKRCNGGQTNEFQRNLLSGYSSLLMRCSMGSAGRLVISDFISDSNSS